MGSKFWSFYDVNPNPHLHLFFVNAGSRGSGETAHLCRLGWAFSTCLSSITRDFPKSDLGPNIGPYPIKKWAKTSQNGVYYSKFLSSTFWWKFHENPIRNSKATDPWKLHKNVNEKMFSFTILCKFSWVLWRAIKATNTLQLYTTSFNLLKMAVQYQFFPILMVQFFPPNSTASPSPGPHPNFRTVGKSLITPKLMRLFICFT